MARCTVGCWVLLKYIIRCCRVFYLAFTPLASPLAPWLYFLHAIGPFQISEGPRSSKLLCPTTEDDIYTALSTTSTTNCVPRQSLRLLPCPSCSNYNDGECTKAACASYLQPSERVRDRGPFSLNILANFRTILTSRYSAIVRVKLFDIVPATRLLSRCWLRSQVASVMSHKRCNLGSRSTNVLPVISAAKTHHSFTEL